MATVGSISSAVQRGRKAVRRFGLLGILRELGLVLVNFRARRQFAQLEREFDLHHGIDTAGIVRLFDLDIPSQNKRLGNRYAAAHPTVFRQMIKSLPIDFADFVFVDYGSGKGRALFLASELPFKRIIGIEFAPELNRIAKDNLARFRSDDQKCTEIESICIDATEYEPPDERAVLYFNNPFEEPVMRKVLKRITRSLENHPREVYVMLTGDSPLAPLIEEAGFVRLEGRGLSGRPLGGDARTRGLFVTQPKPLAVAPPESTRR